MTRGAELAAPPSVHWEIGNAFSALFKRKRLTLLQAHHALAVYARIRFEVVDIELAAALDIAHQLNLYAYDAYLIQAAVTINAPLLSLDRQLRQAAAQMNIAVLEVSL